jgi:hypothetical protein
MLIPIRRENKFLIALAAWFKVRSSNLDKIAYDYSKKELQIRFLGGGHYIYYNVTPDVFEGLKQADSKGKFFWIWIRDEYQYAKLN